MPSKRRQKMNLKSLRQLIKIRAKKNNEQELEHKIKTLYFLLSKLHKIRWNSLELQIHSPSIELLILKSTKIAVLKNLPKKAIQTVWFQKSQAISRLIKCSKLGLLAFLMAWSNCIACCTLAKNLAPKATGKEKWSWVQNMLAKLSRSVFGKGAVKCSP